MGTGSPSAAHAFCHHHSIHAGQATRHHDPPAQQYSAHGGAVIINRPPPPPAHMRPPQQQHAPTSNPSPPPRAPPFRRRRRRPPTAHRPGGVRGPALGHQLRPRRVHPGPQLLPAGAVCHAHRQPAPRPQRAQDGHQPRAVGQAQARQVRAQQVLLPSCTAHALLLSRPCPAPGRATGGAARRLLCRTRPAPTTTRHALHCPLLPPLQPQQPGSRTCLSFFRCRFDTWSAGVIMLQLAVPSMRTDRGLRNFNTQYGPKYRYDLQVRPAPVCTSCPFPVACGLPLMPCLPACVWRCGSGRCTFIARGPATVNGRAVAKDAEVVHGRCQLPHGLAWLAGTCVQAWREGMRLTKADCALLDADDGAGRAGHVVGGLCGCVCVCFGGGGCAWATRAPHMAQAERQAAGRQQHSTVVTRTSLRSVGAQQG